MTDQGLESYSAPHPKDNPAVFKGQYCVAEPFSAAVHAEDLFAVANAGSLVDVAERWRYIALGPYASRDEMVRVMEATQDDMDWLSYVIRDEIGNIAGSASWMRITPAHGSIELGAIWFGPTLKQTRAATEAIYLFLSHAFDTMGYRRFEWKCNNLNEPSKRAALRFGFTFEGVFRNHMIDCGQSRDTAWFSITDAEWPAIRQGFQKWLQADNFDEELQQKARLQTHLLS